jgi:hypothetical protein
LPPLRLLMSMLLRQQLATPQMRTQPLQQPRRRPSLPK